MTLPTGDPAFRWSSERWGAALRCVPLESTAQHLFTTKQLQLRPFASRAAEWALAVGAVGGDLVQLQRIKQVHGCSVFVARDADSATWDAPPAADAVISKTPGHVLAIQVADCLPLLMADRRTGAVGAAHAGWRGTAANIAGAAIAAMGREFGTRPADLVVAMGPGIGPCCYEVGPELIDAFRASGAAEEQLTHWFSRTPDESLRLDVPAANRRQLLDAGVSPADIHVSGLCTQTHAWLFDSYRAAGSGAGRMAALIAVP